MLEDKMYKELVEMTGLPITETESQSTPGMVQVEVTLPDGVHIGARYSRILEDDRPRHAAYRSCLELLVTLKLAEMPA